jgi:hypothetical protein
VVLGLHAPRAAKNNLWINPCVNLFSSPLPTQELSNPQGSPRDSNPGGFPAVFAPVWLFPQGLCPPSALTLLGWKTLGLQHLMLGHPHLGKTGTARSSLQQHVVWSLLEHNAATLMCGQCEQTVVKICNTYLISHYWTHDLKHHCCPSYSSGCTAGHFDQ